ncbi:MAG: hypothetical protein JW955_11675, partial [Sedimentisphaerales bacterium]|nr:hypothetical protein [Sedimentisphaerales bacterium]
ISSIGRRVLCLPAEAREAWGEMGAMGARLPCVLNPYLVRSMLWVAMADTVEMAQAANRESMEVMAVTAA